MKRWILWMLFAACFIASLPISHAIRSRSRRYSDAPAVSVPGVLHLDATPTDAADSGDGESYLDDGALPNDGGAIDGADSGDGSNDGGATDGADSGDGPSDGGAIDGADSGDGPVINPSDGGAIDGADSGDGQPIDGGATDATDSGDGCIDTSDCPCGTAGFEGCKVCLAPCADGGARDASDSGDGCINTSSCPCGTVCPVQSSICTGSCGCAFCQVCSAPCVDGGAVDAADSGDGAACPFCACGSTGTDGGCDTCILACDGGAVDASDSGDGMVVADGGARDAADSGDGCPIIISCPCGTVSFGGCKDCANCDAAVDPDSGVHPDADNPDVDDAGLGDVSLAFHVMADNWDAAGTNEYRQFLHNRGSDAAVVTGTGWIYPDAGGNTFGVQACYDAGTGGCAYTVMEAGVVKGAETWVGDRPNQPDNVLGNGALSGRIWGTFSAGSWVPSCAIACQNILSLGTTDVGYIYNIRKCADPSCDVNTLIGTCQAPDNPLLLCLPEEFIPTQYFCAATSGDSHVFEGDYLFLEIIPAVAASGNTEVAGEQGNMYVGGWTGAPPESNQSYCFLQTTMFTPP